MVKVLRVPDCIHTCEIEERDEGMMNYFCVVV